MVCGIVFAIILSVVVAGLGRDKALGGANQQASVSIVNDAAVWSDAARWNRNWETIQATDDAPKWAALAYFNALELRDAEIQAELDRVAAEEAAQLAAAKAAEEAASARVVPSRAVYPSGNIQAQFAAGFNSACVGTCGYLSHVINDVIPCESSWDIYVHSPYGDGGLAQFKDQTWNSVGGGDLYDPFTVGRNVARMLNAGRQGEWPVCWYR